MRAVQLEQVEARPRRRGAAAPTNCVADRRPARRGSARAAPGCAGAVRQRRRRRRPPSCRRPAARRCPPTSAWSSPCGRSGRAGGRSSRRLLRVHEVDDPAPGRLLLVGVEPGAARGDPARRRDADHLGHHQPGAAERLAAQVDEVEVGRARRRSAEYMSIGETTTRLRSVSPRSRNGWNIGGRTAGRRPTVLGEPLVAAAPRTPGRAAAGCRR